MFSGIFLYEVKMTAPMTVKNELAHAVCASQKPSNRGRSRSTRNAEIIDKIVYVCRSGCQWLSIDGHDEISYRTVYHWFLIMHFISFQPLTLHMMKNIIFGKNVNAFVLRSESC